MFPTGVTRTHCDIWLWCRHCGQTHILLLVHQALCQDWANPTPLSPDLKTSGNVTNQTLFIIHVSPLKNKLLILIWSPLLTVHVADLGTEVRFNPKAFLCFKTWRVGWRTGPSPRAPLICSANSIQGLSIYIVIYSGIGSRRLNSVSTLV